MVFHNTFLDDYEIAANIHFDVMQMFPNHGRVVLIVQKNIWDIVYNLLLERMPQRFGLRTIVFQTRGRQQ